MIEVFEVQSAALADGVYNCYKQKLLASAWEAGHGDKFADVDTTNIEVFNLLENDTVSEYERALAPHDRIAAWPMKDETGESRWVGRPISPSIRMARTTESAPADTEINCNLIDNDGEITTGLGSGVEVSCRTTEGANLNEARPRLADDEYIFVGNTQGTWWSITVFQRTEDCNNP